MLELAISDDVNSKGETVVLTNSGRKLSSGEWPQDSDFQLVGFEPSAKSCEIVWVEQLARDIGSAVAALNKTGAQIGKESEWYKCACFEKTGTN